MGGTEMNTIAVLLFAIISLTSQPASSSQAAAADEHHDVYAIYSILMTDPKTSHGQSKDDLFLIADVTRPALPVEPCIRVPSPYETAYQEILEEYHRRKDKPAKVERALDITKPYELLNADEVNEFL